MDIARKTAHRFAMSHFANIVPGWFAFNTGWDGSDAAETVVVQDGNRFRVRGWISANVKDGRPDPNTRIDYVCELRLDRELGVWHKISVDSVH